MNLWFVSVFSRLRPEVRGLLARQGIVEPTPPQKMAIPRILAGENILLIAPTGTGKTEAAALPLFNRILRDKGGIGVRKAGAPKGGAGGKDAMGRGCGGGGPGGGGEESGRISAVYVTPLRALNRDMLSRLQGWGNDLGISVAVRHGDTTQAERRAQSLRPPDLLITTPETLQVMLTGKRLRRGLGGIKTVVIDEVHELAASKRGSQLAVVLERMAEVAGDFQRVGLSATVGSPETVAEFLVGPNRRCGILRADVERAAEFRVVSPRPKGGDFALARRLEVDPQLAAQIRMIREAVARERCLIFVNTRQAAEVLGSSFRRLGDDIGVHHGSLSKEVRIEVEEAFKAGRLRGLVCTSSMELGIDIGDVDHVIQYSSPREVSRLVQRVGRAGHGMGRSSLGTIIATGPDDVAEALAIARRANAKELEETRPHRKPKDVLANQLVGLALDFGEITLGRSFEIITRSYPFRDLSMGEMEEVAGEIEGHRLVYIEDGLLRRRRRSWEYYYQNLSMIPDEKRYTVYDVVGRKAVGTLDEAFVVNFAEAGATFVARGEIWEIVEVLEDEEEIRVAPINRGGEIPTWSGEEIPVPWTVAQEAGEIRARVARLLEGGGGSGGGGGETGGKGGECGGGEERDGPDGSGAAAGGEEAAEAFLMEEYPADEEAARLFLGMIKSQISVHLPVPDHRTVTVEGDGTHITVNACLGTQANETLGRVLSALLSARLGGSVALDVDPYRIGLETSRPLIAEEVAALLADTDPDHIGPILELTVKNTSLFTWRMVHVARKFGALRRDLDRTTVSLKRVLGLFVDGPIGEEAMRELFWDRLDLDRAIRALEDLRRGEIAITTSHPSPIGAEGRRGGRDVTTPQRADGAVIELLRDRIMNDRVILFCVSCRGWKSLRTVRNVPEVPECPQCGSRMVAALKPWEEEEIGIVRKPEEMKTPEDRRRTKRVYRNANLVLTYGKSAAVALASRGLGPETAARLMRNLRRDEDDFYRDILKAEREYARTKRFWS
ncbi:MAG: putative ATP-dependent RNA helicase [Methanothrix sp.]|nr:MAG: putative ATP-dependent RNA helicase [Methanothrix sp.]